MAALIFLVCSVVPQERSQEELKEIYGRLFDFTVKYQVLKQLTDAFRSIDGGPYIEPLMKETVVFKQELMEYYQAMGCLYEDESSNLCKGLFLLRVYVELFWVQPGDPEGGAKAEAGAEEDVEGRTIVKDEL